METSCKTCRGPLIRKNRIVLFSTGAVMLAAAARGFYISWLWILSVPLLLTGVYLIAWSTIGKGLWCRQCKKF
jgi:hypothetical protein